MLSGRYSQLSLSADRQANPPNGVQIYWQSPLPQNEFLILFVSRRSRWRVVSLIHIIAPGFNSFHGFQVLASQ